MVEESGRWRRFFGRFKITSALAGIGAVSGALAAVALTYLGNIISGYPIKPGLDIYSWNVGVFAVFGAVFGPPLAWSMLRRVPLWRTLSEPALAGVIGSVASMIVAPALFPVIVPAAILGSAWRLQHVYRDRSRPAKLASPTEGPNSVVGHHKSLD